MKIKLANDCTCSMPKVYPSTWERMNASIKKPWYIWYRFYDPLFREKYPHGYLKRLRGMNEFCTLKERQDAVRALIANELRLLKQCCYSPITDTFTEPEPEIDYIISPELELCKALTAAFDRLEMVKEAKINIKSTLKYIKIAAGQLRLDNMPVKDIRRRHIIMLLDQCKKTKDIWTDATYNRYLKDLWDIFRELRRVEAIEFNPVGELEYKKRILKMKTILTPEQVKLINDNLRRDNYEFWRFIHIFCNSGARTTEIMKVRKSDVDLKRQMVKYLIKKGRLYREVERPIKDCVLHLWEQMIITAKDGQFLFSEGLKPGDNSIRTDQVKKRWTYWVQNDPEEGGLGIKATWYSLKYLNTDEMEAMHGVNIAARLNEHGADMVRKHYAVNHIAREHEIIKKAKNSFMPEDVPQN